MLSWFIERQLNAFEKSYDYDVSYMREMLELSPKALMKYVRATSLGEFRDKLPRDVHFAARLVSIVEEDCGPCTQLCVTMAERAGVARELIANVISGNFEALPEPVRVTARFTLATMRRTTEADNLREDVVRRFGRLGLVSIAFAITASRIYPTVKYALGYGHACRRVTVAGKALAPEGEFRADAARSASTRARALA